MARVVPDATVLFSRVLHDLVGRLAAGHRLFDVIWSDELLAETKRVLVREKPTTEDVAERWVRRVREAFPQGRVDPANVPSEVDLSQLTTDRDDEHVCGLAVAGRADILLSSDTGYVRDTLAACGVDIVDPDSFLLDLANREPSVIVAAVTDEAAAWDGGKPVSELLDAFRRARAGGFADLVEELMG